MNKSCVSIITPSFDREEFIAATLESLLAQTYPYWENVVVDDGSTDKTHEIVRAYVDNDSRIRCYDRSRGPKGACTCRNEGVDHCEGEYLIFLDTDDLLEPFCIEQRVKAMEENPDLDFAIFPSLMFREVPGDLGLWWNVDKDTDELTRQFHQDAICQGTGVIWRTDSFNRIGRWDESLAIWQDIDLFFRAYIQGYEYRKFFFLPPDLHNRRLESSLSRSSFFARDKTLSRVEVIKRAVELLKANNKHELVREGRYMTAEIISGASRSRQCDIAKELLAWGIGEGVFTRQEEKHLKLLIFIHDHRLSRIPGMKNRLSRIEGEFAANSTLGSLPYERGPV